MKVYIVEVGCYDDRSIGAVYASPETAMSDNPVPNPPRNKPFREPGWRLDPFSPCGLTWANGCDWNEAATITEYEVIQ